MRLQLAIHQIDDIRPGRSTRIDGTALRVDLEELRRDLLQDRRLERVDLELVHPGEACRVGYVFDVVEPRAKAPGSGADFPGILSAPSPAGQGTTHVLRGAAVTVVDGGQPGGELGYVSRRGGTAKILEMSGPAAGASHYAGLQHLVIVPHAFPQVERHAALNALRVASVKAAVYLARASLTLQPAATEAYDLSEAPDPQGPPPPRVAYIGQVHGHQHGTEVDERILYGSNTRGMLPLPLHPNEWLDGAVAISYSWSARGLETYMHQNHPIILELYRLHRMGALILAGVIATTSASREEDLTRNSMVAAQLAKWNLRADGVILTKYVGGAPHTDMFETARWCEVLGMKTVVLASDTAPDRRAESAMLINVPEVDAVVNHSEGGDIRWPVARAERVIAGNPDVAQVLSALPEISADLVCGVASNQGASRLQSIIY